MKFEKTDSNEHPKRTVFLVALKSKTEHARCLPYVFKTLEDAKIHIQTICYFPDEWEVIETDFD